MQRLIACHAALLCCAGSAIAQPTPPTPVRLEYPDMPYLKGQNPPLLSPPDRANGTQVNVNGAGLNIVGDAGNEPSIAQDPTDRRRIVVAWRQFDTTASNFRQAGVAYTTDFGRTWTSVGPLQPGVFRSDPVLGAGSDGTFYYQSLTTLNGPFEDSIFTSTDGGATWSGPVYANGGDKAWYIVDTTGGPGEGNQHSFWTWVYSCCGETNYTRSVNDGATWPVHFEMATHPYWGTLAIDNSGTLFIVGNDADFGTGVMVVRSANAWNPAVTPAFEAPVTAMPDLFADFGYPPNPGGLAGQAWIAIDNSGGTYEGNVYVLVSSYGQAPDPYDVWFVRSTDGGDTWTTPLRVNTEATNLGVYNWFGTMSVAPNGRIDAVWYQTTPGNVALSTLYYSSSADAGVTWATPEPVSGAFNSMVGWPSQNKIGDYIHMVSDEKGASLVYAATHNGEQDVWFARMGPYPCNDIDFNNDGIQPDSQDLFDALNVFSGGSCSTPRCDGIDFNNDDVYPDNMDLLLFLDVFGGGAC